MNQDKIFTKEEIIAGLSAMFPTFDFKFIDNSDGTLVLSANDVLMTGIVWSEVIGKKLLDYFGCDAKSEIFHILEATIARKFDFDGTNWVEVKPKLKEPYVLDYYGYTPMDTGIVYCPYIPIPNDKNSK